MNDIFVPQDVLAAIWEQLNHPHQAGRNDGMRSAHLNVIAQGWGERHDIQDIFWETDDRADTVARHHEDFKFLLDELNLRFQARYRGPFSNVSTVWGHQALRAPDVAAMIMQVERLGFTVDAEPIVSALRPSLVRQKFLTYSELSVVWYGRQRHRSKPILLRVKGAHRNDARTIITHSGYRATALLLDGRPTVLRVDGLSRRKGPSLDQWIAADLHMSRFQER